MSKTIERSGSILSREPDSVVTALQPSQLHYNGLVFGEGTDLVVTEAIEGLVDFSSRQGDIGIPRGDGDIPFLDFATGARVILPMLAIGDAHSEALVELRADIERAFVKENEIVQRWLTFADQNESFCRRGRATRRRMNRGPISDRSGMTPVTVELRFSDPRRYSTSLSTQIIPAFAPSAGGFDLPIDLPIDMPGAPLVSQLLANNGNQIAWPVLRFENRGPADCTEIEVENLATGQILKVATTIVSGQTLVADMDALVSAVPGPHVYIDTASRYGDWQVPRDPFGLIPGTNELLFTPTGEQNVTCRVDWRDTTI